MGRLFFTSDYHFNHDRDFIYGPRGFSCFQEMNEAIIEENNKLVTEDDDLYILGDLILGDDLDSGLALLGRIRGHKHIILGNHDSQAKAKRYAEVPDTEVIGYAGQLKVKYHKHAAGIFLCHYPTIVNNIGGGANSPLVLNLYGHTHQRDNYYPGNPFLYHIGVDSHDLKPVELEEVLSEIHLEG